MEQLRILVTNHHPIVRNGLRRLLERNSDLRVVGEAATSREAIALAEYQRPDVVVLDVASHSVRGVDAVQTIASKAPKTRVVVLGTVADQGYVERAFDAGACGYVLDDNAQVDLLRAVFVVAAGGFFLSPAVSRTLIDDWNRTGTVEDSALVERRKRLLSLLFEGRHEAEIADMLLISEAQAHSECEDVRDSVQRYTLSKALRCSRTN